MNTLAEASIPETLVKKKAALEQYRLLKKSKGDFTKEVSLPMVNQEQFLPTKRKRKKQQTMDEDPIDWAAPM